jgi:hypothetical protein
MTRVVAKFHKLIDGGRGMPPAFPYSCTTLIDQVARSIRIHHDGAVEQGIPFEAEFEFICDKNLHVSPKQELRFYEGYREVGVATVHDDHLQDPNALPRPSTSDEP